MNESKENQKKISSEECQKQLEHAFLHTPYLERAQNRINTIISRLGEPKLKLESFILSDDRRKLAIKMLAKALESNTTCKGLSIMRSRLDDEDVRVLADM